MKILGIDHIGLVSKQTAESIELVTKILGLPHHGEEVVSDQRTKTTFIGSDTQGLEYPRLEFLDPTDQTSPIAKFMEKKGSGIHHVALRVENIKEALSHLKAHNIELVDQEPRPGAHQTLVAFIHPRATGGLLIELVEAAKP